MDEGDIKQIIAFSNIPPNWNIKTMAKALTPYIPARFVVLAYKPDGKGPKVAYVRLPPGMNPAEVLQTVKVVHFKKDTVYGFMPTDIPLFVLKKKGRTMNATSAQKMNVSLEDRAEVLLERTHGALLREMQTKYLGLYAMSSSLKHRPLDFIAESIWQRLYVIVPTIQLNLSCHQLSSSYRKTHPHNTDMSLIVGSLHRAQKELGVSVTTPTEKELVNIGSVSVVVQDEPRLEEATSRYLYPINQKLIEHLSALNTDPVPQPTEEDRATTTVRQELKKLIPIIQQLTFNVITRDVLPHGKGELRVRVYGEPYMPTRDKYISFVKRFNANPVSRCHQIFNCLWLTIKPSDYETFIAYDGTMMGNAKIICRPSDVPLYKVRGHLYQRMKLSFPEQPHYQPQAVDQPAGEDMEECGGGRVEEQGDECMEQLGGEPMEQHGGEPMEQHGGERMEQHGGERVEQHSGEIVEKCGGEEGWEQWD